MKYCLKESQINPAIHEVLSGPYASESECLGGCDQSSSSTSGPDSSSSSSILLAPLANKDFSLPASESGFGECLGSVGYERRQGWSAAPPWYVFYNCNVYSFKYCNPEVPDDRFIGFGPPTNLCHVGQAVATSAGQQYELSFDMGVQPGYGGTYDRHVEVAVFDMDISELEFWFSTENAKFNPSSSIIYRGNFSIPGQTISNTYESLGWTRKSLQFTATSASTLIMFRTVDTRTGADSNETGYFVVDNVEMAPV